MYFIVTFLFVSCWSEQYLLELLMVSDQIYLALSCCLIFVIFLTCLFALLSLKVGSIVCVSGHEFNYCGWSLLFLQLLVAVKFLLVSLLMLASVNHHWSLFSLWFFTDWLEKLCLLTDLLDEGVCERTMTSYINWIIFILWQQLCVVSWLHRPASLHGDSHIDDFSVLLISHRGALYSLHLMLLLRVCLQLGCEFSDFYHICSVFMWSLNAHMNFTL